MTSRIFFSDNEHYFLNPYMVSAASTPSIVSPEVEINCALNRRKSLFAFAKTGIFHIQYILREEEPLLLKFAAARLETLYKVS